MHHTAMLAHAWLHAHTVGLSNPKARGGKGRGGKGRAGTLLSVDCAAKAVRAPERRGTVYRTFSHLACLLSLLT